MNFWQELRQKNKTTTEPFFCLAPMADVTDCAFRALITKYGKPDVMWTEFVSANGLMSAGRDALLTDFIYGEDERPIVAQIFSSDPERMEGAAELIANLGFDGVDINMGCPDKTIEKQGAGAAMIKIPDKAMEVIRAVKSGIKKSGKNIPISVKTRVGYHKEQLDTWIPMILKEGVDALVVHARTRKDMSKVPANWDYIKRVVEIRDKIAPITVIIGNGDVVSIEDGKDKAKYSRCDGIMIGRAMFGNPWFFDESRGMVATIPEKRNFILRNFPILKRFFETKRSAPVSNKKPITTIERLGVLVEHTKLFESMLGGKKNFSIMKKHYKAYCTGFAGSKELRMKLMDTHSSIEVERIIKDFLTNI